MNKGLAIANPPPLSAVLSQDILHNWKEPILVLNAEHRIQFANQRFCNLTSLPWGQLEQTPLAEICRTPSLPALIHAACRSGARRDFQVKCTFSELGEVTMQLHVTPLGSHHQNAIFLTVTDITDGERSHRILQRKVETAERAELAQRDHNDLLRSILESTGDGIAVLDADGHCILWNQVSEAMLGMKPGDIPYDQWPQHFGFYLPDKVTQFPSEDLPLSHALKGEIADEAEIFVRNHARAEGFWVSMTARPLSHSQDGAVASLRDITFAKLAADALAQHAAEIARSNRELEQFAYVASHDLQEPLRMVSSYVQLLARRYRGKLDAEADEFIAYAADGAKRMQQLINDLLGYSRVGRGEAALTVVDCEALLADVLTGLAEKIQSENVRVTHDPLPKIMGHVHQLAQLFQNLMDNAIKFHSTEPAHIHISAQARDKKWVFSVADNGIGIDPEYKDRVFVIFQRLHTREAYPGTGIGLAICKKIVEQHAGLIWVEPQQPHGTAVNFTWPRD
ncbi:MAG: PAS domain-containing protein [Acidobacteria bacterium]|nr:PAS domain-containing protein [Acidobacteriota bacterium]